MITPSSLNSIENVLFYTRAIYAFLYETRRTCEFLNIHKFGIKLYFHFIYINENRYLCTRRQKKLLRETCRVD